MNKLIAIMVLYTISTASPARAMKQSDEPSPTPACLSAPKGALLVKNETGELR